MAETWTYALYWGVANNAQIPRDYASIPLTIIRDGNNSKDGSSYRIISARFSTNVDIETWVKSGGTNGGFSIGSYGTTENITINGNRHRENVDFNSISDSILNVNSSSVSTSITRTTSDQTIFIYGKESTPCFYIYVDVEYKYQKSTISGGTADFGQNSTVTITGANNYASELTHEVKWTISGNGHEYTTTKSLSGAGNVSALMENSWMNAVPSADNISCSLELKTYKGSTLIGTDTGSCTLNVPASVKPTIGSITCSIVHPNAGIPNTYIQNTTGVCIQINNASAGSGATLTDNFLISANVTETYVFDSVGTTFTVDKLTNCGEITFSVVAKDSRNRQSTPVTATISVMEYALPTITVASAYRCRVSGIADDEGTYACIRIVAGYSQTGGNTIDIDSTYYRSDIPSQKYTAQSNMESGVSYIIGNNTLDPGYAYFIEFTIEDSLGNIITRDVRVQTSAFAIHVKNGGTGVAVGKTSEVANSFEINEGWDMYYKGVVVVPVIYDAIEPGTGSSTITPFEGLVWLKPKT